MIRLASMMFLSLVTISATALLNAEEKSEKQKKPLIPLALGNSWTYEGFDVAEDGTQKSNGTGEESVRGVFVTKEGKFFYQGTEEFGMWLRNTPQGNEDAELEIDEETWGLKLSVKPQLYYRYPVQKGAKYDIVYDQGQDPPLSTMTVPEAALELKVPAGTFSCIKYESRLKETGELENVSYICPGVGLIKTERYEDGKLIEISVLTKYKVAADSE